MHLRLGISPPSRCKDSEKSANESKFSRKNAKIVAESTKKHDIIQIMVIICVSAIVCRIALQQPLYIIDYPIGYNRIQVFCEKSEVLWQSCARL